MKRIATRSWGFLAAGDRADLRNPAELVLGAMLLGALYRVPSVSRLCEALGEDLLFGWFMDLDGDRSLSARDVALDCMTLVENGTARAFFVRFAALARAEGFAPVDVPALPLAA